MLHGQPVFPDGPEFSSPRWLAVLRAAGLRHKVDGPTLVALARQVVTCLRVLILLTVADHKVASVSLVHGRVPLVV